MRNLLGVENVLTLSFRKFWIAFVVTVTVSFLTNFHVSPPMNESDKSFKTLGKLCFISILCLVLLDVHLICSVWLLLWLEFSFYLQKTVFAGLLLHLFSLRFDYCFDLNFHSILRKRSILQGYSEQLIYFHFNFFFIQFHFIFAGFWLNLFSLTQTDLNFHCIPRKLFLLDFCFICSVCLFSSALLEFFIISSESCRFRAAGQVYTADLFWFNCFYLDSTTPFCSNFSLFW